MMGTKNSKDGGGKNQSGAAPWQPDPAGVRAVLANARQEAEQNPFANPILLAACELDRHGVASAVSRATVSDTVQELTADAFSARAGRLRAYLGEVDVSKNLAIIGGIIERLTHDEAGEVKEFKTFAAEIERVLYGFVLTAHPTFTLTDDLQADLVALATNQNQSGQPLDEAAIQALRSRVRSAAHKPDDPMTLAREHDKASLALDHWHEAAHLLLTEIGRKAAGIYPDDWHKLRPKLISIATWVGYDLDGRSDIGWSTSLERRMASASKALSRYRAAIAQLLPKAQAKPSLAATIGLVDAKLALAQRSFASEQAALIAYAQNPDEQEDALAALNRELVAQENERLCDAKDLRAMIDAALVEAEGTDCLQPLWVLACLVGINGLADARTHVRINAMQLHNAVRKAVGMDHAPDDAAHRQTYVRKIAELIENVEPESIHLGSVAHERATAKRVFGNIKLMLRYIDGSEPIRFLIAECDTAFTLLSSLYFAKMFGVEKQVDLSPLFETRTALERGAAILADALNEPVFRDYVRGRGRLCVQTGFSDAGRYLGQTAASNAIEQIRLKLCAHLQAIGLTDIDVLFFDTHGESIGRGSHPGGIADRFAYYDTIEARRRYRAAGLGLIEESSFQGGDGYLYFMNKAAALAVVTRVLEHIFTRPDAGADPFYEKLTYVDEFFAAVSSFNGEIIDDPCYAALLDLFGQNLGYRSGSRAVKRQFDGRGPIVGLQHPSQIRAIPHNSILQQLGILANTIGGIGFALNRDPETFYELYRESDRFRRLMAMVEHAFKYTDLTVVRAYIDIFDPGFWLLRANAVNGDAAEEMQAISRYLEESGVHAKLTRIMRRLMRDHMHLAAGLREHRRRTRDEGEQPIVIERQVRDAMHMLHSLRLALILSLFRRAVQIPDFSDRHDTTHDDAITHLMHLDVLPTVSLLKEVFPLIDLGSGSHDYGEVVSYASSKTQSYAQEHDTLFNPIAEDYETIRRIGAGLTHYIGSFG